MFIVSKVWHLRWAVVALLASGGCRACSDAYDYSSPVADPFYARSSGRAGSNLSGGVVHAPPPPLASESPVVTDSSSAQGSGLPQVTLVAADYDRAQSQTQTVATEPPTPLPVADAPEVAWEPLPSATVPREYSPLVPLPHLLQPIQ